MARAFQVAEDMDVQIKPYGRFLTLMHSHTTAEAAAFSLVGR